MSLLGATQQPGNSPMGSADWADATTTMVGTLNASPSNKKVSKKGQTDMTLTKLPREGPQPGNGRMKVYDRVVWAEFQDLTTSADDPPAGLNSSGRRPSNVGSQIDGKSGSKDRSKSVYSSASKRSRSEESPRSAFDMKEKKDKPRLTPEERKRAEIMSKLSKVDSQRERDLKDMLEVVEKRHERREDRFKRLLENVTGRDNLAYRTAMALRERQDHEDKRRRELHDNWTEQVYQPIALQAYDHMNPPNRAIKQTLHGSKSVGFLLPTDKKTLVANVDGDPNRKPVIEMAKENAFHVVASAVLGHARSMNDLHHMTGKAVPPARSRPTLEPSLWNQAKLQGTLFGHFAQIAEQGANFKRSRRGGTNIHIPDESDMVEAVGKRSTRTFGRNDPGILKGDTAAQGESSTFKTAWGSASGAPTQDHFTYETGTRVTDIEFPLGKKMFAEFH
jgi:hypothetical protein